MADPTPTPTPPKLTPDAHPRAGEPAAAPSPACLVERLGPADERLEAWAGVSPTADPGSGDTRTFAFGPPVRLRAGDRVRVTTLADRRRYEGTAAVAPDGTASVAATRS